MEQPKFSVGRLVALFSLLFLVIGVATVRLMSLQLVHGAQYLEASQRKLTGKLTVTASRGEILDRYGRPLVTNRTIFTLRLDYAYWNKEHQNETILNLAKLVQADGKTVDDELPISASIPFTYTKGEDSREMKALRKYLKKKKLGENLPAPQAMEALAKRFEVSSELSPADTRTIVGVRYTMADRGFSVFQSYSFAHNVSMDLITKIKEQHRQFAGVEVSAEPVREYQTPYAAHILGRVGKIYKEEWEGEGDKVGYKDRAGYSMNSLVGKDGMERALESYLHGVDGARAVETDISGAITNESDALDPKPGSNCILTLDILLQKATEEALAKRIAEIPEAVAGSAVAVQVGTGEILAMASYPTYSLENFSKEYQTLQKNPLRPMLNRATLGLYAPGSTFKPLTAIAGLEHGVISPYTRFTCNHSMKCLGQTFRCLGSHGSINCETAIQKSCNIFFYHTGMLLGEKYPEAVRTYANQFGLGEKTGVELPEYRGRVASPEERKTLLEDAPYLNAWQPGDFLQAAIGQSESVFTPLQLANYIATLAGDGKHYQAHLLKSVKSYDYSKTLVDDTPKLLNKIDMKPSTLHVVKQGMHDVVSEGGTASAVFAGYPIDLAGKSGTAQVAGKTDNGLFVVFAPYQNPEIAICVVIEGGKSGGGGAAPVVRSMLDAYFFSDEKPLPAPKEYTLLA